MTTRFGLHRLRKLVLGSALMLFWASSTAEAIVITNVSVALGPASYTAGTVGWQFPVNLATGQDLVLTQNFQGPPNTTTSFNFDTSDVPGPGNFAQISVTANGVTTVFTDLNQVLNVKGIDTLTSFDNEAQDYGLALKGPGYVIYLGYADNTHTGACGAWASSIGLNGTSKCLPSVFNGMYGTTAATFFQGAGGLLPPPLINTLPNHCTTLADCFEGGVIRIVATNVPEPATLALLLTGVALVSARQYRRTRKRT